MLAGSEALQLVERVRRLAWERRRGSADTVSELVRQIEEMDFGQLRVVIGAFTIFLDLVNVVEDKQRIRVLRERERIAHPEPRGESVGDAILELKHAGLTAKADLDIAYKYADLAETSETVDRVKHLVTTEFHSTRQALLRV